MNCPICGEGTFVKDSRTDGEIVKRIRQCKSCKYTFSTVEIESELLSKLTRKENAYAEN